MHIHTISLQNDTKMIQNASANFNAAGLLNLIRSKSHQYQVSLQRTNNFCCGHFRSFVRRVHNFHFCCVSAGNLVPEKHPETSRTLQAALKVCRQLQCSRDSCISKTRKRTCSRQGPMPIQTAEEPHHALEIVCLVTLLRFNFNSVL